MKISNDEIINLSVCPICRSKLFATKNGLVCKGNKKHTYPTVEGIPILINKAKSVFSQEDFLNNRDTFYTQDKISSFENIVSKLVPWISTDVSYKRNYNNLVVSLLKRSNRPKLLIIGDSYLGLGMSIVQKNDAIVLLVTDVYIGPATQVVCDAHNLPFENNAFDGVVVQGVLEHVLDPYQCVEEIHRVLKKGGVVYSNTPFIQQVHGGIYDFTRFTFLGHRRLFRKFKTIDDGIISGPGSALAWSYKYFLLSFTQNKFMRKILKLFSHLTSFYLKYFDYLLDKREAAYDAAAGFYFMGEKTDKILSDKELIKLYRGAYDR